MSDLGAEFMRSGFNAKDLFVAMAMSQWFRSATTDSNAMVTNVNVGARSVVHFIGYVVSDDVVRIGCAIGNLRALKWPQHISW